MPWSSGFFGSERIIFWRNPGVKKKKKKEWKITLPICRQEIGEGWGEGRETRWIVLSKQFVMNYPVNCNENIWTKISRNSSKGLKSEWCWYWLGVFYAAWLNGVAVQERAPERTATAKIALYFFFIPEIILSKLMFMNVQSYWILLDARFVLEMDRNVKNILTQNF